MITAAEMKNRTFDYEKFVTMPKCKGAFNQPDGSGCLLTAFWTALGYVIPTDGGILKHQMIGECLFATTMLAKRAFPGRIYTLTTIVRITSTEFVDAIILNYDGGNESLALDYLFELIEAVWGTKLDNQPIKEQLCQIV
jgi:hypothetical protein